MAENLNKKKAFRQIKKTKTLFFFSLIKSKVTYTVKDNRESLTVVKGKSRWRNAKSKTIKSKKNNTKRKV